MAHPVGFPIPGNFYPIPPVPEKSVNPVAEVANGYFLATPFTQAAQLAGRSSVLTSTQQPMNSPHSNTEAKESKHPVVADDGSDDEVAAIEEPSGGDNKDFPEEDIYANVIDLVQKGDESQVWECLKALWLSKEIAEKLIEYYDSYPESHKVFGRDSLIKCLQALERPPHPVNLNNQKRLMSLYIESALEKRLGSHQDYENPSYFLNMAVHYCHHAGTVASEQEKSDLRRKEKELDRISMLWSQGNFIKEDDDKLEKILKEVTKIAPSGIMPSPVTTTSTAAHESKQSIVNSSEREGNLTEISYQQLFEKGLLKFKEGDFTGAVKILNAAMSVAETPELCLPAAEQLYIIYKQHAEFFGDPECNNIIINALNHLAAKDHTKNIDIGDIYLRKAKESSHFLLKTKFLEFAIASYNTGGNSKKHGVLTNLLPKIRSASSTDSDTINKMIDEAFTPSKKTGFLAGLVAIVEFSCNALAGSRAAATQPPLSRKANLSGSK